MTTFHDHYMSNGGPGGYTIGWTNTSYSHTHSLTLDPIHPTNVPTYKEPEMSITEKIAQERKEARERERIEAAYIEFDDLLDGAEPGSVWTFELNGLFEALVMTDDEHWSITYGPSRVAYEDAVSWLIRNHVDASDLS